MWRLLSLTLESRKFLTEVLGIPSVAADPASYIRGRPGADAIALWQSLEHLPNPWSVIEAAAATLNRGGILAIATPNPQSSQARFFRTAWAHLDAPRHLWLIPPEVVTAYAKESGLELALLTSADAGSQGWHEFGWVESIGVLARGKPWVGQARALGRVAARLTSPFELRRGRGASYTAILRRP